MGFPERVLDDDEELLLHCHPHWRRLFVPVLALLCASAVAGLLGGLVWRTVPADNRRLVAELAVFLVWAAVGLWATIRPWIRWATMHFAVTDRRVMFRRGLVRRVRQDIPLRRISSVEYRQSLLDRVFRCGALSIEWSNEDPLEFADIPRIVAVHSLLCRESPAGWAYGDREWDSAGGDTPGWEEPVGYSRVDLAAGRRGRPRRHR